LDMTALGSAFILWLVVLAASGFLLLQERARTALAIVLTSASGEIVNVVLKHAFMRPRPNVVSHLRTVASSSLPSGHAMDAAIISLTLGAMGMRVAARPVTKMYCLAIAMFVTFLVGASRVYLGVHYPTDVIGGWIVGFLWASICWLVTERFEYRTGVAQ